MFFFRKLIIHIILSFITFVMTYKSFEFTALNRVDWFFWIVSNFPMFLCICSIIIFMLVGYGSFMRTVVNFIINIFRRFAKK
jgi:hypothetical protein